MLLKLFEQLTDKRRGQAKQYDLPHVLMYTLIAVIANCNTYSAISSYIKMHIVEFNAFFGTKWKKGIGHTALNEVFQGLEVLELEGVFRAFTKKLTEYGVEDKLLQIAFDGKSLRGSYDNTGGIQMLQMVSAYCIQYQMILGHEFIEGQKTNEIPVVQEMIKSLGLTNTIITADAMHCQKKL